MTESRSPREMDYERKIHIYIDISNILCGAIAETSFPKTRLNIPGLIDIVRKRREVVRKVAVGSVPHDCNPRQRASEETPWKKEQFEVTFLQRVQSASASGRYSEQSVDDLLHAAIQEDLLKSFCTSRTLVLLTGDGNSNGGRTSFPKVIQDALLRDWHVEIWAWKKSISPNYFRMEEVYAPNFTVNLLDAHVTHLTYRADERSAGVASSNGNSGRNGIPAVKENKISWQKKQQDDMIRNGFRVKQNPQQAQTHTHKESSEEWKNRVSNHHQHHPIQQQQQHHTTQQQQLGQHRKGKDKVKEKQKQIETEQNQLNPRPITRKLYPSQFVDMTADRDVAKIKRPRSKQNIIDLCVTEDVAATRNIGVKYANCNGLNTGYSQDEVDYNDNDNGNDINGQQSYQKSEQNVVLDLSTRRSGPFTSIADHDTDTLDNNDNHNKYNSSSSSSSNSSGSSYLDLNDNNNTNSNNNNNNSSSSSNSSSSRKRGNAHLEMQNTPYNNSEFTKRFGFSLDAGGHDSSFSPRDISQVRSRDTSDDITDLRDDVISNIYSVGGQLLRGNGRRGVEVGRSDATRGMLSAAVPLNDTCDDSVGALPRMQASYGGSEAVLRHLDKLISQKAANRNKDSLIDLTDDRSPVARTAPPASTQHGADIPSSLRMQPNTSSSSSSSSDRSRPVSIYTGGFVSDVGRAGSHSYGSGDIAQSFSSMLSQRDWIKTSDTQQLCGLLVKRPFAFRPSGPFSSHQQSQSLPLRVELD